MIFENYGRYYDLFYQSKDYLQEVSFLEKVGNFQIGQSVLDLGCGTGGHIIPLALRGYQATGVDLSKTMIDQAQDKAFLQNASITFLQGDVRSVRMGTKFDRVISMFAVMGYQIKNSDFLSALRTAREHLEVNGFFIFDAWFGPAVLAQRPETRVTELSSKGTRIIRIAKPEMNALENTVIVNYTILRLDHDKVLDQTYESHSMRFFFATEVELFAEESGFKVELLCPFLEMGRLPSFNDWNVTWVLKAV